MIDSKKVLYSKGNNDECYTPSYAVEPILKYITRNKIIWCPFDIVSSQFVQQISKQNEVIYSHIEFGEDFYGFEPKTKWDIIVSNPPFSGKRKIFERALSFGKPFALLMTLTWLNDSAVKQLFKEVDLQLLMFDQRIQYDNQKKITFSSAYYCRDFLPKQIIMENINKKH